MSQIGTNIALTKDAYNSSDGAVYLNGEYISKQIIAASHNNLFRGEGLIGSNHFADLAALHTAVTAGNFSDIFIGDWIVTTDPSDTSKTVKWLVAGINVYGNYTVTGDVWTSKNHLCLVPEGVFATTMKMNSTATTDKGYNGSAGRAQVATWGSTLNTYFSGYLINARHLESNQINSSWNAPAAAWSGIASHWGWYQSYAILMSEVQVYGSQVWGGGYDTGDAYTQLPIFRLRPDLICVNGYWYWLKDIASSHSFCLVYSNGYANYDYASSDLYVRPLILFS